MILLLLFIAAVAAAPSEKSADNAWHPDCGRSMYEDAGVWPEERVVGGINARIHEFPWTVSMRYGASHSCGGVVIQPQWALTAAHCIQGRDPSSLQFWAGDHELTDVTHPDITVHNFDFFIIHEYYETFYQYDYDLAVVKVLEEFEFSDNVQPACMPNKEVVTDYYGDPSQIAGWGHTEWGGSISNILQWTEVTLFDNTDCDTYYPGQITPRMICAGDGDLFERDTCQGDSGGPLTVKRPAGEGEDVIFEVVGLTSWGYRCAWGSPGVYAFVAEMRDWITEKIDKN